MAWTRALSFGPVLTVTELTQRVRARLATDPRLAQVAVAGELTGFKRHSSSGHLYFTLKDPHSRIPCVMWRSQAEGVEFEPRDGMQVVAAGYVDVYPPAGAYQLYVQALYPVGLGLLYARLRQLHDRLAAEGIFDATRKRPIPRWPRAIGVVTSRDGAALRDIVAVVRRRSPHTPLYFYPALVQGEGAVQQLVRGLQVLARWQPVDVIIVARGGGSPDELWTFNDERIVRAVAACPVPVVAAVGHETDVTLVDLAADQRAPTPSAAAELVSPDEQAAAAALTSLRDRLVGAATRRIRRARQELEGLRRHWTLVRPERWLASYRQQLDELSMRASSAVSRATRGPRVRLAELAARLSAADPLALLERGYARLSDAATGRTIRKREDVRAGQHVRVEISDGRLGCRVESVDPVHRLRPLAPEPGAAGERGLG